MAKGIIVVNIPKLDCRECQCFRKQFPSCGAVGRYIDPVVGKIPNWCPINPMPKKKSGMELTKYDTDIHYEIGWNECLDEILKHVSKMKRRYFQLKKQRIIFLKVHSQNH